MSYTEYLRNKLANSEKIIDTRMSLGDASTFTNRQRLAASHVRRPTDHIINNGFDPSGTPNLHTKAVKSQSGTGFGGKVQDASLYTATLGATSIGQDVFTAGKRVLNADCRQYQSIAPSLVVNESGNVDGKKAGLNLGYIDPSIGAPESLRSCCPDTLSKSYFVDTIPCVKNHTVGIVNTQGPLRGTQNPITVSSTTTGPANALKDVPKQQAWSARPIPPNILTAPLGPQVSTNGAQGRAPKVGGVTPTSKIPQVESHHGLAKMGIQYPTRFKPTTGAVAQLKINDPKHYPVA